MEGAEARRGDVRSSWSRGLPPAADVRTVNNPERSVEGGIPGRSRRSAPLQPRRGPPRARDRGVRRARARASGRVGAISLGARRSCVCRTAEPGTAASLARLLARPEAAAVTRGPLARRGHSEPRGRSRPC